LGERLLQASRLLARVSDTPRLDAEILLAHALGFRRSQLLARLRDVMTAEGFDDLVERRLTYEPIAYILGEWEFFGLDLSVEPPLLVPRPETEHLVEAMLDEVGDREARVMDIGTGTGCVAVAVAHNARRARVTATDISALALDVAQSNALRHGLADRVRFLPGSLFDALPPGTALFDVIGSNPPYVEDCAWPELPAVIRLHEDPKALLAGNDGLDVIRLLIRDAPRFLRPGGLLAFEIGMGQDTAVRHMLLNAGYERVRFRPDLAGIPRIALACRPR